MSGYGRGLGANFINNEWCRSGNSSSDPMLLADTKKTYVITGFVVTTDASTTVTFGIDGGATINIPISTYAFASGLHLFFGPNAKAYVSVSGAGADWYLEGYVTTSDDKSY